MESALLIGEDRLHRGIARPVLLTYIKLHFPVTRNILIFVYRTAPQMKYTFGKTVQMSQQQAIERVTQELSKEGFGILTEIDVAATLKKKLGVDLPGYRILGACNPQFAHQALQAEPQIGALLPCNVVVRTDASGKTFVEIMDPRAVLELVGRPEIAKIAGEVRGRLERVLAAV
jgi:uncharacterized protein (DUF302 family)